jgi:hypothetical protein
VRPRNDDIVTSFPSWLGSVKSGAGAPGASISHRVGPSRCLVSAFVGLALAPAATEARIVPQRSIAGVHLGMTQARVRAVVGRPDHVISTRNAFGQYKVFLYRRRQLQVIFQGRDAVTSVATESRRERTRSGVGVGSSERGVRRGVRGVRCETIAATRSCHVGTLSAGRRVTDFLLRRGHVVRVTLGFVID